MEFGNGILPQGGAVLDSTWAWCSIFRSQMFGRIFTLTKDQGITLQVDTFSVQPMSYVCVERVQSTRGLGYDCVVQGSPSSVPMTTVCPDWG